MPLLSVSYRRLAIGEISHISRGVRDGHFPPNNCLAHKITHRLIFTAKESKPRGHVWFPNEIFALRTCDFDQIVSQILSYNKQEDVLDVWKCKDKESF